MKYVLDASIAVKWVLPEPDSPKALSLEAAYRNQVHELLAPDTFPVEVAHALTKAERRNLLLAGEAATRLSQVLAYPPFLHSYLPLLAKAVDMASQARIGVYDCLYVALARLEQCRVITADQRLLNTFPGDTTSLDTLP